MHPFILLGQPYTLKHLKDKGFETFSEVIDESYDNRSIMTKGLVKLLTSVIIYLKTIHKKIYIIYIMMFYMTN